MTTPTLLTKRLVLRPLTLDDAPAIQRLFPVWEVVKYLAPTVPWPYPPDGARSYLEQIALPEMARGEKHHWAIEPLHRQSELIGSISLWADDRNKDQRGFWLAPAYHGQGLMTEAAERVTEFAFKDLGWPQLSLTNAEPNRASARVKEKQGARLVGQEACRFVAGEMPRQLWVLTAEEWFRRRME